MNNLNVLLYFISGSYSNHSKLFHSIEFIVIFEGSVTASSPETHAEDSLTCFIVGVMTSTMLNNSCCIDIWKTHLSAHEKTNEWHSIRSVKVSHDQAVVYTSGLLFNEFKVSLTSSWFTDGKQPPVLRVGFVRTLRALTLTLTLTESQILQKSKSFLDLD